METNLADVCSLDRPETRAVLARLHEAARGDRVRYVRKLPGMAWRLLRRLRNSEIMGDGRMKDMYFCISHDQGRFMYLVGRTIGARRVVEFGTSFGVSTIYLAAAVLDNGGGHVFGTELEPEKREAAQANLAAAGLGEVAEVLPGNALESLREVAGPIDLVFLDGWKDLYLPVLELLLPRLRPGAVVLADNIHQFKETLGPYVDFVECGANGFQSVTLPIRTGLAYSVYTGNR